MAAPDDANNMQEKRKVSAEESATGQVKDLRQAALAIGKAEINMKLMLEVRHKALKAYREIVRSKF
jgi:flagellar hook-basal body complex protein FliE